MSLYEQKKVLLNNIELLTKDEIKEARMLTSAMVGVREMQKQKEELTKEIADLKTTLEYFQDSVDSLTIPDYIDVLIKKMHAGEKFKVGSFVYQPNKNPYPALYYMTIVLDEGREKTWFVEHQNEFTRAFVTGEYLVEKTEDPELPRKFYQNPFTRQYLGYDKSDGDFFDASPETIRRYQGNDSIIFNFYGHEELIGEKKGYELVGEVNEFEF